MSVAFGYFVNFVRDYQTGRGGSVMELVSIEDVWFKADNGTIDISLINYGKVDVNITSVYMDSQPVNFASSGSIPVGEHGTVTLNTGWMSGESYHFKLISERGSVFEGEYV
jgi:hypothetical protein